MDGDPATRPCSVRTALGELALRLPPAAELVPDPGVADGEMLVWAPEPELGAFSVSHGPAAGRTAADLIALERAFSDAVDVGGADADLRLRVTTRGTRDIVAGPDGARTGSDETTRHERVRFRFWEADGAAVRAGYRIDETAPAELAAAFEAITDSAHLERG
jgi:hypothetical protein